ncbi:MAG: hypothetical protein ABF513_05650 [Acetobacter malorum]
MEPRILVELTKEAKEIIDGVIKGQGGAQDVLRELKEIFGNENTAYLSQSMVGKIVRLASNGAGGYQNKFKTISKSFPIH